MYQNDWQLGEEGTWFDGSVYARTKAEPRVLAATSSPGLDQLTADATPAYPATAGLRRYVRRLLFVKPNALLVLDDVACEAPRELELRFHTEREVQALPDGGFGARGDQARLRLEPLTRDGVTAAAGKLTAPGQTHAGHALVQNTVTLKTTRAAWRCATAITWAVGAEPARVTLGRDGDRWTFRVGGRTVVFDWATGQSSDG